MPRCLFLGDELSAVGYQSAGLEALTPSVAEAERILSEPDEKVGLVIITAALAAQLPATLLARLRRQQKPPLAVVPDIRGLQRPPDSAASLRRQLGLAE
jgi:vacuolar-type H+-ATPase subunit F/Vma7